MDRRQFLSTSLAGAAGLAVVSSGCGIGSDRSLDLDEVTLSELRSWLEEGRETAVSLTRKYLERIEAMNTNGPSLRAIIEVNPDAMAIAAELDAEFAATGSRGPLHGIPVVLKDNIDTADGMMTTAGSLALLGHHASVDSAVAAQLRASGAILLAKANLSEWANFRSTRSTGGWSARGGLCLNPYALDRNVCGSSSGSAAAVSANLCPVAVGTETDGSVVCPSSIAGIVGIKPTLGLVGQSGIIPIAHSQDTAGPMARTVTDAALLLSAMSESAESYETALDAGALRGARIGVTRTHTGRHPKVDAVFEDALLALKDAGAELVDPASVPTNGQWGDAEYEVLLHEFKSDLNAYLAAVGRGDLPGSLEELIRFNEEHADLEMPFFGQEIFHMAVEKGPLSDAAYTEALATSKRLTRADGIDSIMDEHGLDALVAPTTMPAWTNDLVHGGHRSHGASSAAAVSGYPSVTVPSGFVFGLPVGLLMFGREHSDAKLIGYAYAFEQATGIRQKPKFLPTVDIGTSDAQPRTEN